MVALIPPHDEQGNRQPSDNNQDPSGNAMHVNLGGGFFESPTEYSPPTSRTGTVVTDAPPGVGAVGPARTMARMERLVLSVPDMSCDHCRRAITDAVTAVSGVTAVDVDLDAGRVTVDTDAEIEPVADAIAQAGYTVESTS